MTYQTENTAIERVTDLLSSSSDDRCSDALEMLLNAAVSIRMSPGAKWLRRISLRGLSSLVDPFDFADNLRRDLEARAGVAAAISAEISWGIASSGFLHRRVQLLQRMTEGVNRKLRTMLAAERHVAHCIGDRFLIQRAGILSALALDELRHKRAASMRRRAAVGHVARVTNSLTTRRQHNNHVRPMPRSAAHAHYSSILQYLAPGCPSSLATRTVVLTRFGASQNRFGDRTLVLIRWVDAVIGFVVRATARTAVIRPDMRIS